VVPPNHAVNFYDCDADLVADIARFVADGLGRDERVVIVATGPHRDALDEVLLQHGIEAAKIRAAGRYLTFDAQQTLDLVLVDGDPDLAAFVLSVGALLDAAAADGCQIRVFGEMVALLWEEGNVAGAIKLESLWNVLASTRAFSLLCGYPVSALADGPLGSTSRVCDLHSELHPPRHYETGARGAAIAVGAVQVSGVFVPVPAAIPAARRFVTDVLTSWGEDELLWDAALVTSELGTNAVEHAGSPFRVGLSRNEGVVRIAIEDVGSRQPELRIAAAADFSGRGVAIVGQIAERWGCDALPEGKIVWADLASGISLPDRNRDVVGE
jgi:hypothetical protein